MRLVWVGILLALLSLGCGGEDSNLSRTQRGFELTHGVPSAYAITFADEHYGSSGMTVATPARRIDVWIYGGDPAHRLLFDSGFFVDDVDLASSFDGEPVNTSPSAFVFGMTRADVEAAFGPPDDVESNAVGDLEIEVLRYTTPDTMGVGFVNGQIASVSVGLQVTL